ncbi:uncharacterized protein LOC124365490 [Homalodisca vitripennis]|uniref:uncharacterized protein LOC124365490 n=1 Tax=Homalodisca vitripennis TaxID=197043 RepID=UPI001EECE317|nr:uncharacterized protein LOC124365490 [Homalodisca vitripennis]
MQVHGLSLANSKTVIVLLMKRRRIPNVFPLQIINVHLKTKPAAKYLGVMIDSKLSFGGQVQRSAVKAVRALVTMGRLMLNAGGQLPCKCRLLVSSVQSILLYGAEVWTHVLENHVYRNRLSQIKCRGALQVARFPKQQ